MNKPAEHVVNKTVDSVQQRLTGYACGLNYDSLTPEAIHAAKVRVIDTLGVLIGGFFGEPCRIARNVAAQIRTRDGATVIGTRMKTTPDMAAFVNATTARYVEMNDTSQPGVLGGHPSDTLTPVLAAAEHAQASGREFITGIALAYEVHLRMAETVRTPGFDYTNYVCLGSAVAAGKLLRLSPSQLSHCISMAVVPNNILEQVRTGHLSMFKAVAAGQAGRAGVFAALLARAGMEGPHLPFEGKAGWCEHVARERFSLNTLGGNGVPFMVQDSLIKPRSACGRTIPPILAAEKVAPLKNIKDVRRVTVEIYEKWKATPRNIATSKQHTNPDTGAEIYNNWKATEGKTSGEHNWNPETRETADHSIPYVVAAALMDGTVTPRQFNDAHLWNPELRALMQKIEVVKNEEFTQAYDRQPPEHRARVTVVTHSGERLIGETGGDRDDMAAPKSDGQIAEKFRGLSEDFFGAKQVNVILNRLWHLEDLQNVAEIPPAFILG